ncbi:MAG: AraC family transcriptional regulator ligand-binding domain-containing protein [Pseudomonadota bacterium]
MYFDPGQSPWAFEPNLRSDYPRLFARELGLSGREMVPLLAGTSLTAKELAEPDCLISAVDQLRVYQNGLAMSEARGLGLRFGRRLTTAAHGPIGFMMMSSPNLIEALQGLAQFLPTRANYILLRLQVHEDVVEIQAGQRLPVSNEISRFLAETMFASFHQIASHITGQDLGGLEAHMRHARPAYFPLYEELAPLTYQFEAEVDRILMPKALCFAPNAQADSQAFRIAQRHCEEMLHQSQQGKGKPTSHCVEQMMLTARPGTVSAESVAQELLVSPRTLARRLEAEGTSFREIKEAVLSRQAMALLGDARLSTEAIAALLNFHDSASFRRSFKRWTGQTPSTFRRSR